MASLIDTMYGPTVVTMTFADGGECSFLGKSISVDRPCEPIRDGYGGRNYPGLCETTVTMQLIEPRETSSPRLAENMSVMELLRVIEKKLAQPNECDES